MTEEVKRASWWQTLPGLLTAIAGILTAVGGLVLALKQAGLIGEAPERSTPARTEVSASPSAPNSKGVAAPTTTPTPTPPSGGAPSAPTAPSTDARPWSQAQATITTRDGKATIVRADTFRSCIAAGTELTLTSGQDVPFEQMKGFEVLRSDKTGSPGAKADLAITLLDGQVIQDQVTADCDLFGQNALGRFTTYFDKVRRVDFQR